MINLIRAPKTITSLNTGAKLALNGVVLDRCPSILYTYETGEEIELTPAKVERDFHYTKPSMPAECIPQGKYECGAAALAILLGHSLFQVKRVMGSHGWRNDRSGASDTVLSKTARDFGHDLVFCGRNALFAMLDKTPDCILTIPSLNYAGAAHGVAWYKGQVIDPNYNKAGRKFWGTEWAPWTIDADNALILVKNPLSEEEHKELKRLRKKESASRYAEAVLSVAV